MRQKERTRFVKLYFRNQDKVMVSIPNILGLVSDNVLVSIFRDQEFIGMDKIYEVDVNEVSTL